MCGANRMDLAENYIKQLSEASTDDEVSKLIQNVIEVLEPVASDNLQFQQLRETGLRLIAQSYEGSYSVERSMNKIALVSEPASPPVLNKKRIFFQAFIEVFQIFKCGFKYEEKYEL